MKVLVIIEAIYLYRLYLMKLSWSIIEILKRRLLYFNIILLIIRVFLWFWVLMLCYFIAIVRVIILICRLKFYFQFLVRLLFSWSCYYYSWRVKFWASRTVKINLSNTPIRKLLMLLLSRFRDISNLDSTLKLWRVTLCLSIYIWNLETLRQYDTH